MSENSRRNIMERQAGSIAGSWYIGIWALLGLIAGVIVAGVTGSLIALLILTGGGALYGAVRSFQMKAYRGQYLQDKNSD